MKLKEKLDRYDGLDMTSFEHIEKISCFNSNYYIGFNNDLLYGLSDDHDETGWWLIIGDMSYYMGASTASKGDKLYRHDRI